MLAEFWEFDRKMIHEKYKSVVEGLEERPLVHRFVQPDPTGKGMPYE